jgi:hypothetical protein
MTGAYLEVQVRDQDIIVTMPDTSFRVVYRKPNRGSQLIARLDYFKHDQKGPITRARPSPGSLHWLPRSAPSAEGNPASVHRGRVLCIA